MPWYAILALICVIIGPFDALYMYIKASRRREKMRQEGTGNRQQATGEPRGAHIDEETDDEH